MGTNIDNRKVEKIQITITVDKPDPMPFVNAVDIAKGNWGEHDMHVTRSESGKLFMIGIDGVGYVVDTKEILRALVEHQEQSQ
jgi:hypothetical protein